MPRESHQHPVQMPAEVASTGLDPLHLSARFLPADPSGPKAPDRIAHPGCCPRAPTPPPCGVNRQAGRPVSSGQSQEALPCASPHLNLPPGRKGGADVKARAAPARGSQGAGWARGRGRAGPCKLHPVGPHQSGAEEVCFLFYIPRCWLGSFWTQLCRVKCKPHAYRPLTDGCHCQLRTGQKFSPHSHTLRCPSSCSFCSGQGCHPVSCCPEWVEPRTPEVTYTRSATLFKLEITFVKKEEKNYHTPWRSMPSRGNIQ